MEPRHRVDHGREAAKPSDAGQHSRALMELILHDVILGKADDASRRVLLAFSAAALSALLSEQREKSGICLADLKCLRTAQVDRVLAAARYVFNIQRARAATSIRPAAAALHAAGGNPPTARGRV